MIEAAKTLGYEPHALARALAGERANTIALLVPELSNPIYAKVIRGAFERAAERGCTVLIAEDFEGQVADDRFRRLVAAGHVDGLLIASAREGHTIIASDDGGDPTPHVFVNRVIPGTNRGVSMQVREAGHAAARLLAGLRHRYLGHVSGPLEVDTSRARADGFVETARELGLPEPLVVNVSFDEQGGSAGLLELLEREPRITAVFTTSINQVIGALNRANLMGLRIPQDLSMLAYDDLPLADFLVPPVSTISMPLYELGREKRRCVARPDRRRAPSQPRRTDPAEDHRARVDGPSARVISRRIVGGPAHEWASWERLPDCAPRVGGEGLEPPTSCV